MRRRQLLSLVSSAVMAWPVMAWAQEPAVPVTGVLGILPLDANSNIIVGIRKGLSESGFSEGKNVLIETRRVPNAHYDQLLSMASELVRRPVAVLVATGSARVAQAAKAATTTLPIVFANGSDPVKVGLVASMNRPGGNATGLSFFTSTLGPKRLELLRELVPGAGTIAFLVNPKNPVTEGDVVALENAARSVGQRIIVVRASTENEIDSAFANIARDEASTVLVNVDAFFTSRRQQIVALANRARIPASYNNGLYTGAGGLMSYGDNRLDSYRHVGVYIGRILKGDKPADLPVMQPTKFELIINLKTAKALGLTVPATLLARADKVIE